MPIKVNLTKNAPEPKNNFTEKRRRDRMGVDKYHSDEYKASPKTDRETRSPKSDREQERIFDTEGFKKAIEDAQKNFGKPRN